MRRSGFKTRLPVQLLRGRKGVAGQLLPYAVHSSLTWQEAAIKYVTALKHTVRRVVCSP